eukprot:630714-Rhodomonas_salina.1
MEFDWFIGASEALILTNDKFDFFVNHQHPDITNWTPAQMLLFKQAVITYLVSHGLVFSIASDADNVTPAALAKAPRNYAVITKMLCGIQLQLSDA